MKSPSVPAQRNICPTLLLVGDRQDSIEMRYEDENIWLAQ